MIACALESFQVKLAAQSTSGSIVGIVQDATGAVMPQVTVKIKNLSDNTMRATLTDTAGEYHLLNLKPGSYEIVASKENFVNSIVSSIGLDARQHGLEAGSCRGSQGITVEATGASINTENAVIGDTKNFNQVVQLPMNYRGGNDSPLAALVAVPGVQQDSSGTCRSGAGRRPRSSTP